MKARHVWFVFAFVAGLAVFGFEAIDDGIMWGTYSLMRGLAAGASVTAAVLFGIAILLPFVGDD